MYSACTYTYVSFINSFFRTNIVLFLDRYFHCQTYMSVMETVAHNRSVIKRAKAGDLLEFPRGFYSHWAVYIGTYSHIHLQ